MYCDPDTHQEEEEQPPPPPPPPAQNQLQTDAHIANVQVGSQIFFSAPDFTISEDDSDQERRLKVYIEYLTKKEAFMKSTFHRHLKNQQAYLDQFRKSNSILSESVYNMSKSVERRSREDTSSRKHKKSRRS